MYLYRWWDKLDVDLRNWQEAQNRELWKEWREVWGYLPSCGTSQAGNDDFKHLKLLLGSVFICRGALLGLVETIYMSFQN